jgi:hypothetical protein
VTTYAAAIAARLQGREDEDMGKDESVWNDDEGIKAAQMLVDEVEERLAKLVDLVSERVPAANKDLTEELETTSQLKVRLDKATAQIEVLELQRDEALVRAKATEADRDRARALNLEKIQEGGTVKGEWDAAKVELRHVTAHRHAAATRAEELEHLLATAYVTREIPWTDVTAGMMTIARDGTPWMVEERGENGEAVLRNGDRGFTKKPEPDETVRVLVPYVTDEQAEGLVASELGGTEVGS